MHIGSMRHRVTILKGVWRTNNRGEKTLAWYKWRSIWAAVFPEDGRVYYRAKQENAEVEGVIKTRWQPGLLELSRERPLRVELRGRVFEVLWIRDIEEKRKEMRIAYKEVQL